MKHIMLLFLSETHLRDGRLVSKSYTTPEKDIQVDSAQTNVTAVKYEIESLKKQGKTLDAIFYFATKKVREILTIQTEDGTIQQSHEACFTGPLVKVCPALGGQFHHVDFDEDRDAEDNIRSVAEMARCIQVYRDTVDDNISIIADITGGIRYASLLMLSVMQLLKHSGIETRRVLYTDYRKAQIEDATPIYRTFTLVSGADEFVNFGSVKEIQDYFGDIHTKGLDLDELLTTMEELADAINICQPALITGRLKALQKCIDQFKTANRKTPQEVLFRQIMNVVEKEYRPILENPADRVAIIRWCIKKNFLQQAMTLCTEWIPCEIIDRRICYPVDPETPKECEKSGRLTGKSWQQEFIVSYQGSGITNMPVADSNLREQIVQELTHCCKASSRKYTVCCREPWKTAILAFQEEYRRHPLLFERWSQCRVENLPELEKEMPYLMRAAWALWRRNTETGRGSFDEYLREILTADKFWNQLDTVSMKELAFILNVELPANAAINAVRTRKVSPERKWEIRKARYEEMRKSGQIRTEKPDDYLKVLHDYFFIRHMRNQINHANAKTIIKSRDIIQQMEHTLDNLKDRKKPSGSENS